MKKYIVKHKDSERVVGEYDSREEASKKLIEYINRLNDGLEHNYITIFDFDLEEVEKDVNEIITDFESARKALGGKPNEEFTVSRKVVYGEVVRLEDVARLVNDINPKNLEALVALNELFTIAEAWNKADGFVPDFSDWDQVKWYPWFRYNKNTAVFVYVNASSSRASVDAAFGPQLCFKTSERAEQFGKQFADLYNKAFL